MQPKVILYIPTSIDGQTNGFEIDKNFYQEIRSQANSDAVVMDVNTFKTYYDVFRSNEDDTKQLLIIPDGKGVLPTNILLGVRSTMNVIVLCSRSTPQNYLNFLEENFIKHMIVGYDEINLATAFEELNVHFGVKNIAVYADGDLNGMLMAEELVEELLVFIHPIMVGSRSDCTMNNINDQQDFRLLEMKQMDNELVYLNYRIMKYKF